MATMIDFGSLLQLGIGFGIGFSLLRAPLELRAKKLERQLRQHLVVLDGVTTETARDKQAESATLSLRLADALAKIEAFYTPVIAASVVGSIANIVLLIWASVDPDRVLSTWEMVSLVFFAVGYYAALGIVLELLTRHWLKGIQSGVKGLGA